MSAKFRDHYFYNEKPLTDTDTLMIDLNVVDMVSFITVEVIATNYAAVAPDVDLAKYVKSIELVDGSEVIESLTMQEFVALNFFESGVLPPYQHTEVSSGVSRQTIVMHFGRYKDDLNYFLNPGLYHNPQLKVDVDFSAMGSGNFLSTSVKCSVKARCITEGFEDYKGFMSSKEIYSFTAGTSGDEIVVLPRDYKYRNLIIKALLTETVPSGVISNVKLSCDAGRYVEMDMPAGDLIEINKGNFGQAEYVKICNGGKNNTMLGILYDTKSAVVAQVATDYFGSVESITAEKVGFSTYDMTTPGTPTVDSAATPTALQIKGNCPYATMCIPFGNPVDSGAWFDPTAYGNVELKLTQAAAGACAIILQQLRT